jgi:hypothetical protein
MTIDTLIFLLSEKRLKLKGRAVSIKNEFMALNFENKAYVLSYSLLFIELGIGAVYFAGLFLINTIFFLWGTDSNVVADIPAYFTKLLKIAFYGPFLIAVIGMTVDAFKKTGLLAKEWWFNYFLGLLSLLTSSVIYKYGNLQTVHVINLITGIDAGYFPAAIEILNIVFFVPFFLLAFGTCMYFSTLVVFYRYVNQQNEKNLSIDSRDTKKEKLKMKFKLSRFVAHSRQRISESLIYLVKIFTLVGIFTCCYASTKLFQGENAAFGFAEYIILESEFFYKSTCKKHAPSSMIATLDRGNIVVYDESEDPKYWVTKCEIY